MIPASVVKLWFLSFTLSLLSVPFTYPAFAGIAFLCCMLRNVFISLLLNYYILFS